MARCAVESQNILSGAVQGFALKEAASICYKGEGDMDGPALDKLLANIVGDQIGRVRAYKARDTCWVFVG